MRQALGCHRKNRIDTLCIDNKLNRLTGESGGRIQRAMKMKRFPLLGCLLLAFSVMAASATRAAVVLVDFSSLVFSGSNVDAATGYTWNTVAGADFSAAGLKDSTGATTALGLSATTPDNYNSVGALVAGSGSSPGPAWIGSNWISQDSLFSTTTISMTLSGLVGGQVYNFEFFGARGNSASPVTNNRTSLYTVTSGASTGSANLNTSNNTNATVNFDIVADGTGSAIITLGLGTGNDSGFAYLNALKVTSVPEPGAAALGLLGAGWAFLAAGRRSRSRR
jgi:hypothetical protein